jgi:hypothetical protein
MDRIRILSKYLNAVGTDFASTLQERIRWQLDRLARSLWAGNRRHAAQEVCKITRCGRSAWGRLNQRLECAAYKLCCGLLDWHWSITDEEAAEAVAIARETVALLERLSSPSTMGFQDRRESRHIEFALRNHH